MAIVAYLLLILMVTGALMGVAVAGAIIGGAAIILFMIGFLCYSVIEWIRGK